MAGTTALSTHNWGTGTRHGECGALPGQQGWAEAGIPDQCHSSPRPGILAYAIEVKVGARFHGFENIRALPPVFPEYRAQNFLLCLEVVLPNQQLGLS